MAIARVDRLTVYPVKSARGIDHPSIRLDTRGPAGDRAWMLVDARGRFVSQRTLPAMAQLEATPTPDGLALRVGDWSMTVATPVGTSPLAVTVWDDTVEAWDGGDAVAAALSGLWSRPLRLVWMPPQSVRPADPTYAGRADVAVSFADGFPLLLANGASLAELNGRLTAPIPMDRFRPNLVVDGWEAWQEDAIRRIRIGAVELALVKPCTRCSIPALDHLSGAPSTDPTPVLKQYRYDRVLRGVTFGVNAIIVGGYGDTLRVGDEVTIVA